MEDTRRAFLRYLAGSPLFLPLGLAACRSDRVGGGAAALPDLVESPEDALNVFDLRDLAERNLPPAHYGYLATGVDDNLSLRANRDGFQRFYLRPRRLVDVSRVDLGVDLFGRRWDTPIVLAPCGAQGAFHEDAEVAVARAARARGHLQILSTVASTPVEEVNEARGEPVWYQLYPTDSWVVAEGLLRRAMAAGCRVFVLTVDLQPGGQRELMERYARQDARDCSLCHVGSFPDALRYKPMFEGLDVSTVKDVLPTNLTWDFLQRVRDLVDGELLVKGIMTGEDAGRCVAAGADGVIVSNHGGRAEDGGLSTIEALPGVLDAVGGRVPVLVDGGFRRGHDILKAMALGASAICIGRPYLWGLAAFGQAGVERVLEMLRAELVLAMQQAGVPSLRGIAPGTVAIR